MAGELIFITGATGFIGFAVLVESLKAGYRARVSVRKPEQIAKLKANQILKGYLEKLDFVVIPDITLDGVFDVALEGVTYIQHVASSLPSPTENPERDLIIPALKGTTGILHSALKHPIIRRIVITSSITAVIPLAVLRTGDDSNKVYKADSRVFPLPSAPYTDYIDAYRVSKALALNATDEFIAEEKPKFTIVNIMPGYVIGANELAVDVQSLAMGSNSLFLSIIGGHKVPGPPRPSTLSDIRDVARIQVSSLDEIRVPGNKDFLVDPGQYDFNIANEYTRKRFPEAVSNGTLPLGGSVDLVYFKVDSTDTIKTFGPMKTYQESLDSLLAQYIELAKTKL